MIKNYYKVAFRNFKRHKLFTFINVIGLSIGISSALVIFLIVYRDFTFDKFHKDKDRIYRVVNDFVYSGEPFYNGGVTGPLAEAVRHEVNGVQQVVPFWMQGYNVIIPGKTPSKFKDENNIIYADQRYFNLFFYKWLAGSSKSLNQPNQVVLVSDQAKKYFPGLSYNEMLGKQVIYDDSIRVAVTGVVEKLKENSDLTFSDFISYLTIQNVKDIKQNFADWAQPMAIASFL